MANWLRTSKARFYPRKTPTIPTAFGPRSVYNSVSFCNRCGLCARVCPSYRQSAGQELFSPRGRNQLLRMILEGKFKLRNIKDQALHSVLTCSLCGKCTQVCPAQIPTARHMIYLRQQLKKPLFPRTLVYLLRLRQTWPKAFGLIVRAGLFLNWAGLFELLPISWLHRFSQKIPSKIGKHFSAETDPKPKAIYLPSLEAEFLIPHLASKVYERMRKKYRHVMVWRNCASGLFEYAYGDERRAKKILRALITRHAQLDTGRLPLVTDSIDVYTFFQTAPQLFSGLSHWEQKAKNFAAHVLFSADILPKKLTAKSSFIPPVGLMNTALFDAHTVPHQQAAQTLHTLFKKNFVQCGYSQVDVPPMEFGVINRACADETGLNAVRAVAAHQTHSVFVLSGLAALELSYQLRQFYPEARVFHISELNG